MGEIYVMFIVPKNSKYVLFLFTIVLSVLLRFMDSDYPFGILKLFLEISQYGCQ